MVLKPSKLRSNIYRFLDHVLETGESIEIERKGRRLKIVAVDQPSKLAHLSKHECVKGDPEDIIHLDWSGEWKNDLP